ncbi:MAG: hypothetical protein BWY11_01727 [Firmicutes bacterium ADurb.Bin182]|nr:MAG: hypothetical protein BWY11_01727 [Firmicutes bacterium ADurb.Bin182]
MLHDGLSASERPGDRGDAAFGDGKQSVDNALARDHGLVGRKFLPVRPSLTDGPFLQHRQLHFAVFCLKLRDGLHDIRLSGMYPGKLAGNIGGNHNLVKDGLRFPNRAENVPRHQLGPDRCRRNEIPQALMIEPVRLDAARNAVPRAFAKNCKRPLYAVIYAFDKSRGQFHRKRCVCALYGFSRTDAARFLINLNRCPVAAKLDYFADEPFFAHADHVIHIYVRHAACDDQRTGNLNDCTFCFHYLSSANNISEPIAFSTFALISAIAAPDEP